MTLTLDKSAILLEGTPEQLGDVIALLMRSDLQVTISVELDGEPEPSPPDIRYV